MRRKPERGRYDRETIHTILDEAPICHVSFVHDGSPASVPTIHARMDDVLFLHGSPVSRALTTLRDGAEVCVTATIVDALVLARSALHHSMNYRSVVVYGRAEEVRDADEKMRALRSVVEHVLPGRWDEVRRPNAKELAATLVLRLPLDESSAKVRTGPPIDEEGDHPLPVWAGEIPLRVLAGEPVADPALSSAVDVPPSVARLRSR